MAGPTQPVTARRLLAMATAALPRSRRHWGQAMSTELAMRAYINGDLEATAPGVAVVLTIAGAVFAPIGAAVAHEATIAWSHLRQRPRH